MNERPGNDTQVLLQFPHNTTPSQHAEIWERWDRGVEGDPNDRIAWLPGGILGDYDREMTWRNANNGRVLVTKGLCPPQRNEGWNLKPLVRTRENEFESIGIKWVDDPYFYIQYWVLCDDLTEEQYQEWEGFRRSTAAKMKAIMKRQGANRDVQLEF